ncbi:asparagine synthase (glutamine-hydrolyzing) [Desulfoscipio gibsoniae]|uniref:asparagine synthase (glutamine-hydrolyzing) n=1 Tax=Desulfoscipio gibsoniae DSM 7213 TaxID=767817 RepID=R4KQ67_9FIRM|nr:asparagine synthase (glutamine-hydrolyzing) [Desulfoscipio gibsoniae]AGL01786.1 asparagine synthase, glutamine-hydrolyzing [Desulfoscipio gibsoniae DSM 7213]
MCGITGWIDWNDDLTRQRPTLEAMNENQFHRGPDAGGTWISTHVALGHRRLAVVDPTGGGQPMLRRRGDYIYVMVYNGELYNTPELRRELVTRGYTFSGHSDTEVLLLSYIEWGEDCLQRLNGIYALAIWSERDQSLFMARDRLGVKPLFYARRGSALFFGSELKSLLAHPAIQPELDADGLTEVLIMGPGRTPGHGVFRNVAELKPGYYLVYNRSGLRIQRYWQLESRPHEDDLNTTAAKVRKLFHDAVTRQLVADVPVCTLLSGGLDSSAITAVAAEAWRQAGAKPLQTWSVDFFDNERYFVPDLFQPNTDAHWVQRVSESLGTDHHTVIIDTPELVDALAAAVRARDLPGMADVDASLYLFSRAIKQSATVALSGECADEIFGGYPWFHRPQAAAEGTFPWLRGLAERMHMLAPEVIDLLRPVEYVNRRYQETLAEVPRLPGEKTGEARLRELMYLTINWFKATLLDRKDRMSMAVGLEVRVPFCDHRLVEYAWNIPGSMKNYGGKEKGILRRALTDLLPEEVLSRRKSPYPKSHHPAYLKTVRKIVTEILADSSSPLLPLINRNNVRRMIQSNAMYFNKPFYGQLMTDAQYLAYLIQVDTWLREYNVIIR